MSPAKSTNLRWPGSFLRSLGDQLSGWVRGNRSESSLPILPSSTGQPALEIVYQYDPLSRLTAADYSDGAYYHYTYDAAGNRLSETTSSDTTTYIYDAANRLASVNGVAYTWDANGNLLSDGVNTYFYDSANRMVGYKTPLVITSPVTADYQYNGLGDRMAQTVNGETTNYTLDLNAGLTQVLDDGTYTYLYGVGRVAQIAPDGAEYFLGDALGSVRQLVDEAGAVMLTQSYTPFGEILSREGGAQTSYAFTGESYDASTGLVHLRARWYAPGMGRFTSRDTWQGDDRQPASYNAWLYVYANPVNLADPSGMFPVQDKSGNEVVRYIVQRIREDSESEAIQEIRELNSTKYYENACDFYSQMSWWQKLFGGGSKIMADAAYADAGARAGASTRFGCLVADAKSRPVCGQWDYKADISPRWGNAQTVDFSVLGINDEEIFYYDIWANFHFGYLGMVGGFSEETLLTGAAIEHAASNLEIKIQDDPSDLVANQVGINMYKYDTLSETTLLWWIYFEKDKLNKAIVKDGQIIEVYR